MPNPIQRLQEISLRSGEEDLSNVDIFSYSWVGNPHGGGYEKLDVKYRGGGGFHFQGVFHPGEGYCEGNPCKHCGAAFLD